MSSTGIKMNWENSQHKYFRKRLLSIPHRTDLWLYLIFEVIEHHLSPSTETLFWKVNPGRISDDQTCS